MALPLIGAGVMAGMSLLGSAEANAQARQAYNDQVAGIKRSLEQQLGQIAEEASAQNEEIALEMATNRFEGLKATATTSAVITERNLAGNLAARVYDQSLRNKTMAHNALAKKAEDAMISYGSSMEAKRKEAINAMYGASAQLSANTKSTLSAVTSAIGAGFQGYMMGKGLSSGGSTATTSGGSFINPQTLTAQSTLPSGGGVFVNPNTLTARSFIR